MSARTVARLVLGVLVPLLLLLGVSSPPAGADLPAPTDLRAVAVTSTSVEVEWSAPEGAIFFRLAWTPSGETAAERDVAWTARSSFTITGLRPGTSYDVRVRAVDGQQPLGLFSDPLTVTTSSSPGEPGAPPPPPTEPPPGVPAGDTLFGANYTPDARVDEDVYAGRARAARVFFQQLDGVRFSSSTAVREALADGVKTFVISWKETELSAIDAFLADIPDDVTVYTAYHHEPENDAGSPGSAAYGEWAAAYRRTWVAQAPVMRRHDCIPTSILMAYTLVPSSGRDVADWMPPDGTVDVMAFDAYYGRGKEPAALVARMSQAAADAGVGVTGLGETGAPVADPARLANTVAMRNAVIASGDFAWALYWNSVQGGYDSRMNDALADAWFGG